MCVEHTGFFPHERAASSGFTLIELLIYSAIIGIVLTLILGIMFPILRINLEQSGQILAREEAASLSNRVFQGLFTAREVGVLPDWGVRTTNSQGVVKSFRLARKANLEGSEVKGFAWNDTFGYLSFNCANTTTTPCTSFKVTKSGTEYAGWAWSPVVGWVSFNCSNQGSCATSNYKVSENGSNELQGWGWSDVVGWISFNCADRGICATSNYKVSRRSDDVLIGQGWSDVAGWLVFDGSDGTVLYKEGALSEVPVTSDRVTVADFSFQQVGFAPASIKVLLKVQGNDPNTSAMVSNEFSVTPRSR